MSFNGASFGAAKKLVSGVAGGLTSTSQNADGSIKVTYSDGNSYDMALPSGSAVIDDTETSNAKVWSSGKTYNELNSLKSELVSPSDLEGVYPKYTERNTLNLGNNIMSSSVSVDLGSGWSGNFTNGFTLSNASGELKINVSTESGKQYFVRFATTSINGMTLYCGFENGYFADCYFGGTSTNIGLISNGNALIIKPKSNLTVTITNIDIAEIGLSNRTYQYNVYNTYVGEMTNDYNGIYNTAFGSTSLTSNDNGTRNIALGTKTLRSLKSGDRNIAIGTFSMDALQNGSNNIAIGADSMEYATETENNIAIGLATLESATSNVSRNIAIGHRALEYKTTGNDCIAIGAESGRGSDTDSTESVYVGSMSGYHGHSQQTFIGHRSGYVSCGTQNVCIGNGASIGSSSNTWDKSIAIGSGVKTTKTRQTVIGTKYTTETRVFGNLVVGASDGTLKKIVFNSDGTCTWETITD